MPPVSLKKIVYILLLPLAFTHLNAQIRVNSFVTVNNNGAAATYNGVKGAGLHGKSGSLFSSWDSTGTNFTVKYGGTASSITSITQITVNGYPDPFTPIYYASALVKVRRRGNAYVNDTRNYFTVWANYSSEPAAGATTGTFNIIPPEMTDPETTFLTSNINIGIDNIFENTNSHLHANNIERIDYIVPTGLRPGNQTDLDGTGVLVMDRGSGDPFKIAAILSLDASNQPASYGPPVAVSSTHFGPTLLPASANYCALTKDPKFGTTGRPSSPKSQNIAGVILTLSDLGVAIGQRIYGYSIVDVDVNVMNTDWTTYPNDTDSTAVLDPASVFGFYKTAGVILASSNTWKLSNYNGKPLLRCSVEPALQQGSIQIERSVNGQTFENIYSLDKPGAGEHSYLDPTAPSGRIFYRLKFIGASGQVNYSGVESILIPVEGQVQLSPNPCKDRITVTFPVNWQKQTVHATLLTSDGRTIQDQQFAATCSKDLLFNCPSNGSYYLKIENKTSGEVQLLPVLVIK